MMPILLLSEVKGKICRMWKERICPDGVFSWREVRSLLTRVRPTLSVHRTSATWESTKRTSVSTVISNPNQVIRKKKGKHPVYIYFIPKREESPPRNFFIHPIFFIHHDSATHKTPPTTTFQELTLSPERTQLTLKQLTVSYKLGLPVNTSAPTPAHTLSKDLLMFTENRGLHW